MEEHFARMTIRRLEPGTLAEFERARRPGTPLGGHAPSLRLLVGGRAANHRVVILASKQSCDAWRVSEAEARRRAARSSAVLAEANFARRSSKFGAPCTARAAGYTGASPHLYAR